MYCKYFDNSLLLVHTTIELSLSLDRNYIHNSSVGEYFTLLLTLCTNMNEFYRDVIRNFNQQVPITYFDTKKIVLAMTRKLSAARINSRFGSTRD